MRAQSPYWSIPPLWDGMTVAILASGAGTTEEAARAVQAARVPCIAINTTHRRAPFADMVYAADADWWRHPTNADVYALPALRVTVTPVPRVLLLRNTGRSGYDPDPTAVRTGENSGYQAIHIAMTAKARRILLVGFNMTGPHWHGTHPPGLREAPEEHYALFRKHFSSLVEPAKTLGVEIINCTPGSTITCFEHAKLEDVLCPAP